MKIKSQLNLFIDLVLFLVLIPVYIGRGDIHKVLGYAFGIMLMVHLVLHAKQLFALVQARIPMPKIRTAFVSTFCILCVAATFFSLTKANQGNRGRFDKGSNNISAITTEKTETNEGYDD